MNRPQCFSISAGCPRTNGTALGGGEGPQDCARGDKPGRGRGTRPATRAGKKRRRSPETGGERILVSGRDHNRRNLRYFQFSFRPRHLHFVYLYYRECDYPRGPAQEKTVPTLVQNRSFVLELSSPLLSMKFVSRKTRATYDGTGGMF